MAIKSNFGHPAKTVSATSAIQSPTMQPTSHLACRSSKKFTQWHPSSSLTPTYPTQAAANNATATASEASAKDELEGKTGSLRI